MSLAASLFAARALIAGGWSEPTPTTSSGEPTTADAEGVARFDVVSALEMAAATRPEFADAYELLEMLACPATHALNTFAIEATSKGREIAGLPIGAIAHAAASEPGGLLSWLEQPHRKHVEVLALFDKAIRRARNLEEAA